MIDLASFSQEKLVNMTESVALLGPLFYWGQITSIVGRATTFLGEVDKLGNSAVQL